MKSNLNMEDPVLWHVAMDDNQLQDRLTDEQVIHLVRRNPEKALRVWKPGLDQWSDPSSIGLTAYFPEPVKAVPQNQGLPERDQDFVLAFDKNKLLLALQVALLWSTLVVLILLLPGEVLKPEYAVKWSQFWLTILTCLGWQILLCGLGSLIRLELETGRRAHWREAWKYLGQQFLPVAYGPMVFNLILGLVLALTINRSAAMVHHGDYGLILAALSSIPLFVFLLAVMFLSLFVSLLPLVMGLDGCDTFSAARKIYQSALVNPVGVLLTFPLRRALPAIFFTFLLILIVLGFVTSIHSGLSGGSLLILLPKGYLTLPSSLELGLTLYLMSGLILLFAASCVLFVYLGCCFACIYNASPGTNQSAECRVLGLGGREPLKSSLQNANRVAPTHD